MRERYQAEHNRGEERHGSPNDNNLKSSTQGSKAAGGATAVEG
jgi:hypothetical protein